MFKIAQMVPPTHDDFKSNQNGASNPHQDRAFGGLSFGITAWSHSQSNQGQSLWNIMNSTNKCDMSDSKRDQRHRNSCRYELHSPLKPPVALPWYERLNVQLGLSRQIAMRHILLFSVTQQQANNYMYISAYIRFSALYAMIKATANMKSLPFGDQNSIQHWTTKNSRIFERLSRSVGGDKFFRGYSRRSSVAVYHWVKMLPLVNTKLR
ncbi:hypothetical protein C8Q75DRAFT_730097 [Abortiporus biennis]|nr:hypothetical protein C8Q75DRAFT_730097 [Abortiporus biennis]